MSNGGPVFIVGMPRSGTTLMRSIVNAHPSIAVAPETHFVAHWMQVHRDTDLTDPARFDAFWAEFTASQHFGWLGLPADEMRERIHAAGPPSFRSIFTILLESFASERGKPRTGEKTPSNFHHLDLLFGWYPDARVLFMVRDPRAVVASHQSFDRTWTERPVSRIALGWQRSVVRAERRAEDERVLLVRYERLVTHPHDEVRAVCDHLEERFVPEMLQRRGSGTDASMKADGEVSTDSVDRWRHELSTTDIAVTEHLGRGPMARLGYEPFAPRLPLHSRVALDLQAGWRRAWGSTRQRLG